MDSDSVNILDEHGKGPLYYACLKGDHKEARRLIVAKAHLDVHSYGAAQWTPLHVCTNYSRKAIALLLLEAGADPTRKTSQGKTPAEDGTRALASVIDSWIADKRREGKTWLLVAKRLGVHKNVADYALTFIWPHFGKLRKSTTSRAR